MPDSSKITRYLLEAPALRMAAQAVLRSASPGSLLVLPSARAARQLQSHLGEDFQTFQYCTPGDLIESLLETTLVTAPPEVLVQLWTNCLAEIGNPDFPAVAARPLAALRDELSSAGLDVASLLALHGAQMPAHTQETFEKILELERAYEMRLEKAGLVDRWMSRKAAWSENYPERNTRQKSIRQWRANAASQSVWLIGCAELSPFVQRVLLEFPGQLSVAIITSETNESGFSELGVLNGKIDWDPGAFHYERVNSLWASADLIISQIKQLQSHVQDHTSTARTAIGILNRSERHVVAARLAEHQIAARDGHGSPLSKTAPWQVLDALSRFRTSRLSEDFLTLLNIATQHTVLIGVHEAAIKFDIFNVENVPRTIRSLSTPGMQELAPLLQLIDQFLTATIDLSGFLASLLKVLKPFSEFVDTATFECWELLQEILPRMLALPDTDRNSALSATLATLANKAHEPRGAAPAVEILGWLELFLDESPEIFVLNPSADLIPGPPSSNPFLPESLRRELGLVTHESRTQRDRYRWWYITNSKRNVRVFLQETGARGEPLLLSPCLLPLTDAMRAAKLILQKSDQAAQRAIEMAHSVGRVLPQLDLPPPEYVSVTGIGDYLACPYRFALKHILKLSNIPEKAHEFDALVFGSMLHAVIDAAVHAELKGEIFKTSNSLRAFLEARLTHALEFSEERQGAALIQIESLKARLAAYATWHIEWRESGWKPLAREYSFSLKSPSGLAVRGRIDRVERNMQTGETILLDIKTSEKPQTVESFHRYGSRSAAGIQWKSLQLPLYYLGWYQDHPDFSAESLKLGLLFVDGTASVSLAYSKWGEHDIAQAYEQFVLATSGISAGIFAPPTTEVVFDLFPFVGLFESTSVAPKQEPA